MTLRERSRTDCVVGSHEEKGNGALAMGGVVVRSRLADWSRYRRASEAPLALIKHLGAASRRRSRARTFARSRFVPSTRACLLSLSERDLRKVRGRGFPSCHDVTYPLSLDRDNFQVEDIERKKNVLVYFFKYQYIMKTVDLIRSVIVLDSRGFFFSFRSKNLK